MALPATDTFDRANSGTLGANWTAQVNNVGINTNLAAGQTASASNADFWNADTFANDQYAQAVITTVSAGNDAGPTCRAKDTGAGTDAYFWSCTGTSASFFGKYVNGAQTNFQTGLTTAAGETAKINAVGTSIKVWKNGVQVGTTQTDSSIATGSGGLYIFGTTSRLNNWEAGNETVAGTKKLAALGVG